LEDLLIVHGRYAYMRIAKVIGYFFMKNITYTMTQFWFTLFAAYSGQRFYDDWYQSTYNLFFTSVPVLIMGLFDQDVNVKTSKGYPGLYKAGIRNDFFDRQALGAWVLSSIWCSLCIFFGTSMIFWGADKDDGLMGGHWSMATAAYTYVVLVVNIRIATIVNYHTGWHHFFTWGSIAFWFIFALVYNGMKPAVDGFPPRAAFTVYGLIHYLFGTARFFLGGLLIPVASLMPDMMIQALHRQLKPADYMLLQEAATKSGKQTAAKAKAEAKTKNEEGDAEGAVVSGDSGTLTGGVVGVTEGKPHTGYAFEHPGFEGQMTLFVKETDRHAK